MPFDLVPDNEELSNLLARQVNGPYRFLHDAPQPYVRIEPLAPGEVFTVYACDRLRLIQNAREKRVSSPIDFAVIFDYSHIRLVEVSPPDPRILTTRARPPQIDWPITEVASETVTPAPQKRAATVSRPKPMKVIPSPGPSINDLPICAALHDLAVREKLETDLGDYLVIPVAQAQQYAPLPPWATTTKYVEQIHVVKPRLGTDTPIRSTGESYGE